MKLKVGFETGKMAGFDFGLTTFLMDSDGNKYSISNCSSRHFGSGAKSGAYACRARGTGYDDNSSRFGCGAILGHSIY